MYYCYFCGGKLPDSLRGERFTKMSEEELNDIRVLVKTINSEEKMREILGEPDEEHEWIPEMNKDELGDKLRKWQKNFRYNQKWETVCLDVYLMEEGNVEFSFSGKYIK